MKDTDKSLPSRKSRVRAWFRYKPNKVARNTAVQDTFSRDEEPTRKNKIPRGCGKLGANKEKKKKHYFNISYQWNIRTKSTPQTTWKDSLSATGHKNEILVMLSSSGLTSSLQLKEETCLNTNGQRQPIFFASRRLNNFYKGKEKQQ